LFAGAVDRSAAGQLAFGFWEMTRPLFIFLEKACVIFPTLQLWLLRKRLALTRVLPLTPGTMEGGGLRLKAA
jgi:hypothetical protein